MQSQPGQFMAHLMNMQPGQYMMPSTMQPIMAQGPMMQPMMVQGQPMQIPMQMQQGPMMQPMMPQGQHIHQIFQQPMLPQVQQLAPASSSSQWMPDLTQQQAPSFPPAPPLVEIAGYVHPQVHDICWGHGIVLVAVVLVCIGSVC